MEYARSFGRTLILFLLISSINCSKLELTKYTVIDFLQDVLHLHPYDQIVFAHNRNATLSTAFVTNPYERSDLKGSCESLKISTNSLLSLNMDYTAEFVHNLMLELAIPVILLNELNTFELKNYFGSNLMMVVLLDDSLAAHATLFRTLVTSLKHRMQLKILFLINSGCAKFACDGIYLRELFKLCWFNKIINVVALCSNYKLSGHFYSYTHFPVFELEQKPLTTELLLNGPIYPYRLGNLHGYKLPYIIGGSKSRVIVYNWKGRKVVGGVVGHFIRSYAKKHNCTLYEPLPSSTTIRFTSEEALPAVRNNTVDISIGLTYPSIPIDGYTYPYEQMKACLWMPVEADIPHYDFIWIVFEGFTFVLTFGTLVILSFVLSCAMRFYGFKPDLLRFIFHDDCLRGVLSQSIHELPGAPFIIRFIYLHIYILGILLTTSYNSYFATYWTSAPKVAPFHDFDDILHQTKLRVYAYAAEFEDLLARADYFRKYASAFHIERDYSRYLETRDAFNMNYIYIISTTKWEIFREQQKIFTSPLFRYRFDLCFPQIVYMCFPVHNNSIFTESLQFTMLETAQSGLTEYWLKHGFLELIRAGRLNVVDLSKNNEFRPMKYGDMKIVWMGYGVAIVVGILVLLMEIFYFRREQLRRTLQKNRMRNRFR